MQTDLGGALDSPAATAAYVYATRYRYTGEVLHNDNHLRVFPWEEAGQSPREAHLWLQPEGRGVEYRDRFGNRVRRVRIIRPHTELVVAAAGRVSLGPAESSGPESPGPVSSGGPVDGPGAAPAVPADASLRGLMERPEAYEFSFPSPLIDPAPLGELARSITGGGDSWLETVQLVNDWVYRRVRYYRGDTNVSTTAVQVADTLVGVCQDKAHLAAGLYRALGLPSRYVSGLLTGQVGETHAWVEALHPRYGWLPTDPTKGVVSPPNRDYIKLAVGRDYSDVPPVSGTFLSKGTAAEFSVAASVWFGDEPPAWSNALALLEDAFVVNLLGRGMPETALPAPAVRFDAGEPAALARQPSDQ